LHSIAGTSPGSPFPLEGPAAEDAAALSVYTLIIIIIITWAGYLGHPLHCSSWPICTAVERLQWCAAPAHEDVAKRAAGSGA